MSLAQSFKKYIFNKFTLYYKYKVNKISRSLTDSKLNIYKNLEGSQKKTSRKL